MNRKVKNTIEQGSMIKQGDRVIVAVSGGADSVALLDVLSGLVQLRLELRACHLNHCLRGAESERDEQLVRTMCAQYGIPLDLHRVEVARLAHTRGLSIETAARQARYDFFEELAERYCAKLATAHTVADSAETVLFNLARGTGITGLCGIPPVRGAIIRPLIGCTRAEVEEYCARHDLAYVCDSSNRCDDFSRNFIRHQVIPALSKLNPRASETIAATGERLRQDADFLNHCATIAAQDCVLQAGLSAEKLRALHPALRGRVLAGMLVEQEVEVNAGRIARLEELVFTAEAGAVTMGKGRIVRLGAGLLRWEDENAPAEPVAPRAFLKKALNRGEVPLENGKKLCFLVINCIEYENFKNNNDLDLKNAVDYDKIESDILVRTRLAGDRIRLPGRGCTKTLKKWMNELALPGRDRLCVISDSGGVVFCEAVGIDERVAVDAGTKKIVVFTITEDRTI